MSQLISIMLQSFGWPKNNCLEGFKMKENTQIRYYLRHYYKHLWPIFAPTQSIGYKSQPIGHYKRIIHKFSNGF